MSKTYAIGDLHGRLDILEEVLRVIEEDAGSEPATFVCCGDFIDRGPDGAGIIAKFRAGPALPNWTWVILKGNHEDIMYQVLTRGNLQWWYGNGGIATLMSYGYNNGDKLLPLREPLEDDLKWIFGLPIYHMDEHRAYVHAGFNPRASLEDQNRHEMMWQRGSRQENYKFLGRHVVHGHEQYEDGPILNHDVTNVDTFAWLYGRQAIAVFDDSIPGGPTKVLWAECDPHPYLEKIPD